jgi:hypothetical protein
MKTDLSDELGSLELHNDRRRKSSNSSARRNYGSSQNKRHSLHSKRSATIDHGNHEEKLRIVVLGATKVG